MADIVAYASDLLDNNSDLKLREQELKSLIPPREKLEAYKERPDEYWAERINKTVDAYFDAVYGRAEKVFGTNPSKSKNAVNAALNFIGTYWWLTDEQISKTLEVTYREPAQK